MIPMIVGVLLLYYLKFENHLCMGVDGLKDIFWLVSNNQFILRVGGVKFVWSYNLCFISGGGLHMW